MTIQSLLGISPALFALLVIWSIVWKGFALWKAAGLRQKAWFIIMLIINTVGILEIIYLLIYRKHKVRVVEE